MAAVKKIVKQDELFKMATEAMSDDKLSRFEKINKITQFYMDTDLVFCMYIYISPINIQGELCLHHDIMFSHQTQTALDFMNKELKRSGVCLLDLEDQGRRVIQFKQHGKKTKCKVQTDGIRPIIRIFSVDQFKEFSKEDWNRWVHSRMPTDKDRIVHC